MMAPSRGLLFVVALTAALASIAAPAAQAQTNPLGKLRGAAGSNFLAGGADDEAVVQASAKILPAQGNQPARLQISAKIKDGWHIYSITQKPGGPVRSKIKIPESPQYKLGEFKALTPPDSHPEPAFDNLIVEEHTGVAIWEAPLELAAGGGALKIAGAVNAQACKNSCLPPTDYKFEATAPSVGKQPSEQESPAAAPGAEPVRPGAGSKAQSTPDAAAGAGPSNLDAAAPGLVELHSDSGHLTLRGRLEPGVVAPGGVARIVISGFPEPPFHAYALAERDDGEIGRGKPTLIALAPIAGLEFAAPQASSIPVSTTSSIAPMNVERYYSGAVEFVVEAHVSADAAPGTCPIQGVISYQTCTLGSKQESVCDRPGGAGFRVPLEIVRADDPRLGGSQPAGPAALSFTRAKYNQSPLDRSEPEAAPAAAANATKPRMLAQPEPRYSLIVILAFSFLGGMILNLMPCVLPVIGLKLLSFVSQAGSHRSRVLALNLWYTAGVMVVFLVLATLASAASLGLAKQNFGWGQHFSSVGFVVTMCAVVFTMALSLLGVWEIPIPGFVGSGKGTELAAQEGPAGAFFKGVMSTILATPCSGPFLGTVFGFTVNQSTAVIYLIFTCIALGMASPYLVIGAFPALIRWLPKPGAWMDTFKQLIGFTLMGAVVFLLSTVEASYRLPTLGLLLGLAVACWWIGRVPLYAEAPKRLLGWAQATVFGGVIGYVGFVALLPQTSVIAWKEFSPGLAEELAASGKTVMVEFTADWCLTCKTNLRLAINTEPVQRWLEENGAAAVLADWTKESDQIRDAIKSLDGETDKVNGRESIPSIPVLAIYPAWRPKEPLVLKGVITQSQLLSALERAGPSDADAPRTAHDDRMKSVDSRGRVGSH